MEKHFLPKKAGRGFAVMSPERQREIASLGGKLAHAKKVAHEWSPEEASKAGKKGAAARKRTIERGENDGCEHLL